MSKRSQRGPSSPAEVLERRAERLAIERWEDKHPHSWGPNHEQLQLPSADDVAGEHESRGRYQPHRRLNVFATLKRSSAINALQLAAAERLMEDVQARMGLHKLTVGEIDPTAGRGVPGSRELVTHQMLEARARIFGEVKPDGRTVLGAFQLVGLADRLLLTALAEEAVCGSLEVTTWWRGKVQKVEGVAEDTANPYRGWRATVLKVTGETDPAAQAARVRGACENLRLAYEEIDRRPRQKPAA